MKRRLPQRGGTEPAPYRGERSRRVCPGRRGAPGVWLPPAKFRNGIWGVSHGHPALRKQRWWCAVKGRCRHRPLRGEGEVPSTTQASGAQRSVCGADGRNGRESQQRSSPKCPATPDNPSVTAFGRASSLYTREPLGTGDADCRVGPAGLLAMTSVFCHSEERSDVGIRSFPTATAWAALSEAESAGIIAGQIRSLPDTLRVQHGAESPEV